MTRDTTTSSLGGSDGQRANRTEYQAPEARKQRRGWAITTERDAGRSPRTHRDLLCKRGISKDNRVKRMHGNCMIRAHDRNMGAFSQS
eukprot:scaffold100_cov323-Pavlova_lutheri.AAC.29